MPTKSSPPEIPHKNPARLSTHHLNPGLRIETGLPLLTAPLRPRTDQTRIVDDEEILRAGPERRGNLHLAIPASVPESGLQATWSNDGREVNAHEEEEETRLRTAERTARIAYSEAFDEPENNPRAAKLFAIDADTGKFVNPFTRNPRLDRPNDNVDGFCTRTNDYGLIENWAFEVSTSREAESPPVSPLSSPFDCNDPHSPVSPLSENEDTSPILASNFALGGEDDSMPVMASNFAHMDIYSVDPLELLNMQIHEISFQQAAHEVFRSVDVKGLVYGDACFCMSCIEKRLTVQEKVERRHCFDRRCGCGRCEGVRFVRRAEGLSGVKEKGVQENADDDGMRKREKALPALPTAEERRVPGLGRGRVAWEHRRTVEVGLRHESQASRQLSLREDRSRVGNGSRRAGLQEEIRGRPSRLRCWIKRRFG